MSAIENTLAFLLDQPQTSSRRIRALYLNNYFTVVELDDTSVGACMSSYRLSSLELAKRQTVLREALVDDPLLLHFSPMTESPDGVVSSVRTAIVSALSAPVLRSGRDQYFVASTDFPHDFFKDINCAVVIGFGGYLEHLAKHVPLRTLHVSDLLYHSRRAEMDGQIARYRRKRPQIEITISEGADTAAHLA